MNINEQNNKLFKNSVIYFIGNFSSKILSFFMLPLYSKYLTTEQYGSVDLIFTSSQLIIPFVTLEMARAVFRYLFDCKSKDEIDKTISTGFYIIIVGIALLAALSMGLYFLNFTYFGASYFILFGAGYIITNILVAFIMQVVRALKHNVAFTVAGVVTTLLQISLNIVFIVGFNLQNISLLLAPIIANLLIFLFLFFYKKIYQHTSLKYFSNSTFKQLFKFSFPTIPGVIIWWFLTGFTKYYLEFTHSMAEAGIFAMAMKFGDILTLVFTIFNMAWQDVAFSIQKENNKDAYVSEVYNSLKVFLATTLMILLPLVKIFAKFLLKGDFFEATQYVPLLCIMAYFSLLGSFFISWFSAEKRTDIGLIPSTSAAILNVLFSFILIKKYSIWGASAALTLATITYFFLSNLLSRKFIKVTSTKKSYIALFPLIATVAVFYIETAYFQYIVFSINAVLFFLLNNRLIIGILKKFFGGKKFG